MSEADLNWAVTPLTFTYNSITSKSLHCEHVTILYSRIQVPIVFLCCIVIIVLPLLGGGDICWFMFLLNNEFNTM